MCKRVRVRGLRGHLLSTLIRGMSSIEREADACACTLDARGRQKCVALWNVRVPKRLLACEQRWQRTRACDGMCPHTTVLILVYDVALLGMSGSCCKMQPHARCAATGACHQRLIPHARCAATGARHQRLILRAAHLASAAILHQPQDAQQQEHSNTQS